jgi:hypothetical protein
VVGTYSKKDRLRSLLLIAPSSRVLNASRLQVFEGIEKTLFLEIEGVVVGQGTAIYTSHSKNLNGGGICAEVKDFGRVSPRLLVFGNSALQIDDA